jgi:hypothetical protein
MPSVAGSDEGESPPILEYAPLSQPTVPTESTRVDPTGADTPFRCAPELRDAALAEQATVRNPALPPGAPILLAPPLRYPFHQHRSDPRGFDVQCSKMTRGIFRVQNHLSSWECPTARGACGRRRGNP